MFCIFTDLSVAAQVTLISISIHGRCSAAADIRPVASTDRYLRWLP